MNGSFYVQVRARLLPLMFKFYLSLIFYVLSFSFSFIFNPPQRIAITIHLDPNDSLPVIQ